MNITKQQLRQIIKEEISSVLNENSTEELLDAIKQTYTRVEDRPARLGRWRHS